MNRLGRAAFGAFALASLLIGGCRVGPAESTPPRHIPLHVHFAGTVRCNAFPYSCFATLSVANDDAPIDAVRSLLTDTRWFTAKMGDTIFDSTPVGGPPTASPGKHRLVLSVLGSSDVPSYDTDGDLAQDLVARCSADMDAKEGAGPIDVLVTFTPDPTGMTYEATCSIEVTAS